MQVFDPVVVHLGDRQVGKIGSLAQHSQNAVKFHQPFQAVQPFEIRQTGTDALQHLVVVEKQAAGTFVQQPYDRSEFGHGAEISRKDILVELDHFGTTIQIVVFIVNPVTQMKMGHIRANKRNIARREFADAVSDETLANPLRNGDQLVFGMIMPVRRKVFEYKILLRKRRSGCRNNGFVKHDLILLSKERPLVQI